MSQKTTKQKYECMKRILSVIILGYSGRILLIFSYYSRRFQLGFILRGKSTYFLAFGF